MSDFFCINTSASAHCNQSVKLFHLKEYLKTKKMAFLGKLVALMLLACASALPKIQHRADSGNNGYDFSQYFNSEKFQQYLKENPSALNNYFNFPSQSSSSNTEAAAVQSDSMLEDQQSQQGFSEFTNYQQYMEKCMGQSYSSFGSSSQSSGTKAEGKGNPWDQYISQSPYKPSSFSDYQKQWEKCQQQIQQAQQSYASQGSSNYQNYFNPSQFTSNIPSGNNAQSGSS